jgi:hypothetical protein
MLDYITIFSQSNNFFKPTLFYVEKDIKSIRDFRPCFQRFASGQDDKVNERNQIMRSSSFIVLSLVDVGVAQRQKNCTFLNFQS